VNNFLSDLEVERVPTVERVERVQFDGELDVRYIDGHGWRVLDPFTFRLGEPDGPEFVTVGIGFVTDFASIPFFLKGLWPSPGGAWDKPAVIHDCLYKARTVSHINGSHRIIDRAEADAIFREAMTATNTRVTAKNAIYAGVRIGGWNAWNKYRKAEAHAGTTAA
jgi:hypothetical protein